MIYILKQGGKEISRSHYPGLLDFSELVENDCWEVVADYGKCQSRIAYVLPCSCSDVDAVYAVDTDLLECSYYVDGSAFISNAVRSRLVALAGCGAFTVYKSWLPCVTVRPVLTLNGFASPYKSRLNQ